MVQRCVEALWSFRISYSSLLYSLKVLIKVTIDKLPEGYGTKKKRFETSKKKGFMIKVRLDFFGFCLIEGNRIFVSAAKTGMVLNSSGELLALVKPPEKKGFGGHFTWYNGNIYTKYYVFNMKKIKSLK